MSPRIYNRPLIWGVHSRAVFLTHPYQDAVLLILSITNLVLLLHTSAECVIRLDINATSSSLIIKNTNLISPAAGGTSLGSAGEFDATVPRGLSGVLYAYSPTLTTCPPPSNRTAWLSALPSFSLTSVALSSTYSQPIAVYPGLHMGKTQIGKAYGTYDYNLSDISMTIRASNFTAAAGASGGFVGNWGTRLANGWLVTSNSVTGDRKDPLLGVSADVTSAPMSLDLQTVAGGPTLVLQVPLLNLTYLSVGQVTVGGQAWNSFANTTLTAALVARARLDCPSYCGDFGRCAAVNTTTAACVCDCGWSAVDGKCSVPWGSCAAGEGQLAGNNTCNQVTSTTSAVNGVCPDGYDWDQNGVKCTACPSGFSGSGCAMCSTHSACKSALGSSTAECSLGPTYRPRTAKKHYSCALQEPTVVAILGSKIDFTCSTTKPNVSGADASSLSVGTGLVSSNTPVGSTPYCALSFRLPGMPRDAAVMCTGWACAFGVNISRVHCPVVKCACPKGCSSADGLITEALFTSLSSDVAIACGADASPPQSATTPDGTTGCTITLSGLPVAPIPAACKTTECIDSVNGTVLVTNEVQEDKENLVAPPVIALVPTMVLALAAIGLAAAVAAFHSAAGPPPHAGQPSASGGGALASAGPTAEGKVAAPNNGIDVLQGGGVLSAGEQLPPPPPQLLPGQLEAGAAVLTTGSGAGDRAAQPLGGNGVQEGGGVGVKIGGNGVSGGRPLIGVLSWHGVYLSTRSHRSALRPWHLHPAVRLLQDVSGQAVSGEVLGVLGPSGSGKTTLLSVLSGIIQPGRHWRLSGTLALDGRPVSSPRHLAALVGHVPQHDSLGRSLTVVECVAAAAALRLSAGELARGRAHVQARVTSILRELGIAHLAHRVVWPGGGTTLSTASGGLSGGERLRLAAALELVADPPVLLLDEPLSGLDSATARATMAVLRAVAAGGGSGGDAGSGGGRVVVASLHQPSLALFGALDSVLLLSVGGRVAVGGRSGAMAGMLTCAGLPLPPPDTPLPDHLLDLVVNEPQSAAQLAEYWRRVGSTESRGRNGVQDGVGKVGGVVVLGGSSSGGGGAEADEYVRALVAARVGGAGWWWWLRRLWLELGVLGWRGGLDMVRNPAAAGLHVGVTGAIGLLVGAVFSSTDLNVSGAQNRVGAIFFSVMLLSCFATSAVDAIYPERAVVERDMLRHSYGILAYTLAKLVLDAVLLRWLPAWAFGLPFYWLMGLRGQAAAFFTFMGAFSTLSCLSGAACLALSFLFASPGRTVLVLNLLLLICALFSGFLANKASIVPWLRWIVYLSPIRFCWEALVINELKPLVLTFSAPDLPQGLPAVRGSLFLSLLGVKSSLLITDLIVLGCMYGILAFLAVAAAGLWMVGLRGRWR